MESTNDVVDRTRTRATCKATDRGGRSPRCRAPRPDGLGGELREFVDELTGCGKVFVAGSCHGDESSLDHRRQRSPLDVVWLAHHGEFRQNGDHVAAFDEREHGAGVVDPRMDAWLEACASAFGFHAARVYGRAMFGHLRARRQERSIRRTRGRPVDASVANTTTSGVAKSSVVSQTLVAAGAPGEVIDDSDVQVSEPDRFEALLAFEVLHLDQQLGEPLAQSCENPRDARDGRRSGNDATRSRPLG